MAYDEDVGVLIIVDEIIFVYNCIVLNATAVHVGKATYYTLYNKSM